MFNFPTIKQAPLLGLLGSGGGNAQGARKSTGPDFSATGGIQSPDGSALEPGDGYGYHFFEADGTIVLSGGGIPAADVFVVGGGGGSGGGGGGAGSVVNLSITFPGAATYPIQVGDGGTGGNDGPTVAQAGNGQPSYIAEAPGSKLVEAGGGGGGGITDGSGPPTWKRADDGLLGASGGGQSAATDGGAGPGAAGPVASPFPGVAGATSPTGGFGYAGGSAHAYAATNSKAAGGGGAGSAGVNADPPSTPGSGSSNGGEGVTCPWIADPVMFTTIQGTIQFGRNAPNNDMDSSSTWKTNSSAPMTFGSWPGTAGPYSPSDGAGANSFQVLKMSDGRRVRWAVSTDATSRYLWASEDGVQWTSPGSYYDTATSTQYVESKFIAWAGGANTSTTTVTASTCYGVSGPGSSGRWFAGGGGGGSWGNPGGEGGNGGGGEGGSPTSPGNVNALRGKQNTGSGAGGNGYPTWGGPAPGGDGFIAIRYSV